MVRRNGQRRNKLKYSPLLYTLEDVTIGTANTSSSDQIYSVTDQTPVSVRFRRAVISMVAGNTATSNWFAIRRVPSGYTAGNLTIATGSSSFSDVPDVLGYAFLKASGNAVTTYAIDVTWLKPTITLFNGDQIIVQGVPSTTSSGNQFSMFMEYGVCYL